MGELHRQQKLHYRRQYKQRKGFKMKKVLIVALLIVLASTQAFAAVAVQDDGTNLGAFRKLNFEGSNVTDDDGILDVDLATPTFTSATVTTLNLSGSLTDSDGVVQILGQNLSQSGGTIYINGQAITVS